MVFTRISFFILAAPFFAVERAPALVKIGLGIMLSLAIFPFLQPLLTPDPFLNPVLYVLTLGGEMLVGLALGFICTLIFSAIRIGGEILDIGMGFAYANLLDPQYGTRITLVGQFMYLLGILLFLSINGHHSLIAALFHSFYVVPFNAGVISGEFIKQMVNIFAEMFALGFRIAAPIIAILLISDLTLGLVARTVPQLHVFILGFPLKAGLGLLMLSIIMPLMASVIGSIFNQVERDVMLIMGTFHN